MGVRGYRGLKRSSDEDDSRTSTLLTLHRWLFFSEILSQTYTLSQKLCQRQKKQLQSETRQECSLAIVVALVCQFKKVSVRGGFGRPRNTNDREDLQSDRVAKTAQQRFSIDSTPLYLSFQHQCHPRETISETTDRDWLAERRPLRRLPLTPHHTQCRLDTTRATWSVRDWRRIFSDESIQSQC
ncbi:hypothetical protein TNCV_2452941 [Trichonephila clavipes]|nr:hypothetical protein TNCV_2452941 [Trichonephila clavipes]